MRSHITRWAVNLFVWMGMLLFLTRPIQAEQTNNAFTQWLSSVTVDQDNPDLRTELLELRSYDGEFQHLLKQASDLVREHNEQFNLPLSGNEMEDNQIGQLLIVEWNQHDSGNAMNKTVIVEYTKPLAHQPIAEKIIHAPSPQQMVGAPLSGYLTGSIHQYHHTCYAQVPLSGGTAIGAP